MKLKKLLDYMKSYYVVMDSINSFWLKILDRDLTEEEQIYIIENTTPQYSMFALDARTNFLFTKFIEKKGLVSEWEIFHKKYADQFIKEFEK